MTGNGSATAVTERSEVLGLAADTGASTTTASMMATAATNLRMGSLHSRIRRRGHPVGLAAASQGIRSGRVGEHPGHGGGHPSAPDRTRPYRRAGGSPSRTKGPVATGPCVRSWARGLPGSGSVRLGGQAPRRARIRRRSAPLAGRGKPPRMITGCQRTLVTPCRPSVTSRIAESRAPGMVAKPSNTKLPRLQATIVEPVRRPRWRTWGCELTTSAAPPASAAATIRR